MQNIPASQIVSVTPSVIGAGGSALDVIGLILTHSGRVPIGQVSSFPSASAVASFFGASSIEAIKAGVYFSGFDNSNKKPGALLFAQYPSGNVAAYLQGGNVAAIGLSALQAVNGPLQVLVDGVLAAGTVNLASGSSFSAMGTLMSTALGKTVTFDSVSGAFTVTSGSTGSASSIGYATGSVAGTLLLTAATGAVTSQGAGAGVPGTNMSALVNVTQDWACFMTAFEPSTADKVLFAAWTNGQGNRYAYVMWDTDITPTGFTDTASAGYQIKAAGYSGTIPIYEPSDLSLGAFMLGVIASLDFTEINGRATMAFRSQTGLTPSVTDQTIAQNLIAHGYNFYGSYSTANDVFVFCYPGSITGPYLWIDSYINQIWLNNAFQLALLSLLVAMKSIPYNRQGYSMIEAACLDPINQAVTFGAIRPGITLSNLQAAEVNNAAGLTIDDVLSTRGWYLQVLDALPIVRAARASPPCSFWYMDGQSIQKINLASVEVQ